MNQQTLLLVLFATGCGEHIQTDLAPSRPIGTLSAEEQAELCEDVESYKRKVFDEGRKCALAVSMGLAVELNAPINNPSAPILREEDLPRICEGLEERLCSDLSTVEGSLAEGFGVSGCSLSSWVNASDCTASVSDGIACLEEHAERAQDLADSFDCSFEYYSKEPAERPRCDDLREICR